ncbi:hypothetical protein SKC41_28300 [Mycobacterium sp. 050128]|uniref:hypothetical protein n=1 Tax=Mycobacterium sp. 050128 TaxID=3096112 RepID=UPI002EDA41F8
MTLLTNRNMSTLALFELEAVSWKIRKVSESGRPGLRAKSGCPLTEVSFCTDADAIVRPRLTMFGRSAHHLIEEISGMQGQVDVVPDKP